ncbi:MAG: transporter [Bacteroidales bacterium]|nr:transporter [Bacteroidales bacterium]
MKKLFLIGATALMVSNSTFAGGILTNTNQNATFLRNPARNAAIAIDGVYSNPAGIAFLPQGFHLSVSWQAAFQKRQIDVNGQLLQLNGGKADKYFEGVTSAPVIPSFQAAYVINDKWSVSAQFAIGGGGGACEFENGLPMFEELVGGKLVSAQATSYGLNQNLTGEQYLFGLQVGATYKLTDNFSVFGGARGVLANSNYTGAINNITANGVAAGAYMNGLLAKIDEGLGQIGAGLEQINAGLAQLEPVKDVAGYKEQYVALQQQQQALQQQQGALQQQQGALKQGAALLGSDFNLDCAQSGFGITPIIGLDWKLGKLNLGAKYEFRTKIELENDSKSTSANVTALMPAYKDGAKVRSDIPALLSLGAQYEITDDVRAMVGGVYYWDKDAKGSPVKKGDNTWEANFGLEWDVTDKILLSLGGQRTQFGFDDADMADTNFFTSCSSIAVGGAYKFSEKMKLNVGYMHSFYDDHKVVNAESGITRNYTRKNDALGVSLDITF